MTTAAVRATPTIARKAAESAAPVVQQQQGSRRTARAAAQLSTLLSPRIQPSLRVSAPLDPAEREAEATARHIMAMPDHAPHVRPGGVGTVALQPAEGAAAAAVNTSDIAAASAGGAPLPADLRGFMERRFRANFSNIKVHTDDRAGALSNRLGARAFAYGGHLFFAREAYRPDTPDGAALIAHELTHTIQQGAVTQGAPPEAATTVPRALPPATAVATPVAAAGSTASLSVEAAARSQAIAAPAAARSPAVPATGAFMRRVTPTLRTVARVVAPIAQATPNVQQAGPVQVQRFGLSDVLDFFADKANLIPGYRMFTIVLGINPINMSHVDRSAANILRALVEFIPGGGLIVEALDKYGVFDKAGAWIEQQIDALGLTGSAIRRSVMDFIDDLGLSDLFHPSDVWHRAVRLFTDPIDHLITLGRNAVSWLITAVKDAILKPLADLASRTRAWDLLIAVLGRNPITGEEVPRTADTLIGGFMKLIGQEEIWNNIKRANAIPRAWAWFQGVLAGVLGFVRSVPDRFIGALRSLEISDIILLPRAFAKVGAAFATFVFDFISWAGGQVLSLLEIIFEVVAPSVVPYLKRAAGAFRTIIRDPIRFVGLLVRAGIQGFRQFLSRFLTHLRTALVTWLTGTLSGANIYIPQAFTFVEIVKFVLSVLGLTWQNIRAKLVRAVGETAVLALEAGFDIVKTLVTQGPGAAWEKIQEGISNLRDMVIEQVMSFVQTTIVQRAITTLLTSLNPAGAFIQAIIATYNTVMFFIERIRQIAQVAASFIDAIATIAAGNIQPAAERVERTMAGLLVLVISFLARIAGLGRVSDMVINVINRVRAPIDRALDRVVDWIVAAARSIGRFVAQAGVPQDPAERLRLAVGGATAAARGLTGRITRPLLEPILAGLRVRYGLTALEAFERNGRWWARAAINPELQQDLGVPSLVNPADAGQTTGVLDLYRGIYYRDKTTDYAAMDPQQLRDQLIREEDFADAVYAILGITRAEAPTTTLEQRRAAAQIVVVEAQAAHSVVDVRSWWRSTRRATLFFQMLQRFVNRRTAYKQELQQQRVTQLTQLAFTDIPFISTTKNPARAAQYAKGVVVATNIPATSLPNTTEKVVGKVFVYLFSGSDLTALRAVDIRFLTEAGTIAAHARYSKSDAEVTFTGSIPSENRVGELLVHDNDSTGSVAGRARQTATSSASGRGGLLPWS